MKNPRSAWIVYTVLRLLFFAGPFALVYVLGLALQFTPMLSAAIAALIAALIGVSLSVIFLSKQRSAASESIYNWRNRSRTEDDIVEDEAVEAVDAADTAHETPSPRGETA